MRQRAGGATAGAHIRSGVSACIVAGTVESDVPARVADCVLQGGMAGHEVGPPLNETIPSASVYCAPLLLGGSLVALRVHRLGISQMGF